MSLDIRQLECFIAVAEEGNVGRAAARLFMTQPPLTRRIKRLEDDVGATLFERTPRGVEITAPGVALLEQARRIVAMSQRAVEVTRAAQAGETGELVAAYFGTTIFGAVPELLGDFAHANPGLTVRIDRVAKTEQAEAVRDGRIHVGFGRLFSSSRDLTTLDIIEEPLFAAVRADHRLAGRKSLTIRALEKEPLILFPRARPSFADEVLQLCAQEGFEPTVHSEVEDAVSGLANVAVGSGIAVVPMSATNIAFPGVTFVGIRDAPSQWMSCIYREEDSSPALRRFLEFLGDWTRSS